MKVQVWLVDDDDAIRWVLERAFSGAGWRCRSFASAADVLTALARQQQPDEQPQVLLSDIRMAGMDGLTLLSRIKQQYPQLPVIIMTAHSDLQAAVSAYQHGAFDYLPKPFDIDDVLALTERAIEHYQEQQQPLRERKAQPVSDGIIGEAPAMQDVFRIIGRLSTSSISVLINGESGTGKELVAQALHQHSPRADARFIALNMAAIPKELIESELFGHEKGAFTGASQIRRGHFEQADGGTLFLDEIGDMPLEVQTRLLRVLADGQFYRVGGYAPVQVDVRIIAATHQNLEQRVRQGAFREDLYHRLNVIRLQLPPLRERREDIPQLAQHFLQIAAHELGVEAKQLHPDTQTALSRLPWPGNVRQLENTCRWLTVMAAGKAVLLQDLPAELFENTAAGPSANSHLSSNLANSDSQLNGNSCVNTDLSNSDLLNNHSGNNNRSDKFSASTTDMVAGDRMYHVINSRNNASWCEPLAQWVQQSLRDGQDNLLEQVQQDMERVLLQQALQHSNGHKQQAAKLLGLGRNTLTRKLKTHGIE